MPKINNRRVYPDANHQPRHKAAERKGLALARQEVNDGLTLEQKIAKLPPEPYSKKERARLLAALDKQNNKEKLVEKAAVLGETPSGLLAGNPNNVKTKKYMKGSK